MPNSVIFQFLLGVEGTGHHLQQALFLESKVKKKLISYGVQRDIRILNANLWDTSAQAKGIWSVFQETNPPEGDPLERVANQLRRIEKKVIKNMSNDKGIGELVIPISAGFGYEFSYPMKFGQFRDLQYPDINNLYQACDMAGVTCRHILLSRDPYKVMRSTVKRDFSDPQKQIMTSLTMQAVIESQLSSNPNSLAACWNFDDGINDQGARFTAKWQKWNDVDFKKQFTANYTKSFITEKEKYKITNGDDLGIYMESLVTASNYVYRNCIERLTKREGLLDSSSDADGIHDYNERYHLTSEKTIVEKDVIFQFLIGTKGTGHHMHEILFDASPLRKTINSYGISEEMKDLMRALYNKEDMVKGIWSAPCADTTPKGAFLMKNLVDNLRVVVEKVNEKNTNNKALVIPINAIFDFQMSYPSDGPNPSCQYMQYPNIEILYKACETVGVSCRHAFVSRDPYEILRSITSENEHHTFHLQIKSMMSMLSVIEMQLKLNPTRLAACWDFSNGFLDEGGMFIARSMGWTEMGLNQSFPDIGKLPYISEKEKDTLRNGPHKVYMNDFVAATNRINKICTNLLDRNHKDGMYNSAEGMTTDYFSRTSFVYSASPTFPLFILFFVTLMIFKFYRSGLSHVSRTNNCKNF